MSDDVVVTLPIKCSTAKRLRGWGSAAKPLLENLIVGCIVGCIEGLILVAWIAALVVIPYLIFKIVFQFDDITQVVVASGGKQAPYLIWLGIAVALVLFWWIIVTEFIKTYRISFRCIPDEETS